MVTYTASNDDGYIQKSSTISWADCEGATSGDTGDTGASYLYVQSYHTDSAGDLWQCRRAFIPINTSGIPNGATITEALLIIYSHTSGGNAYAYEWTTDVPVTVQTYDDYGSAWTGSVNNSSVGWVTFTFNSTGRSGINKTGYTNICLRESDYDVESSTPNNSEAKVTWRSANYASYDPYLSITYYVDILYPNADTDDGYVYTTGQATWTLARDATVGAGTVTDDGKIQVRDAASGVPLYGVSRGFIVFDGAELDGAVSQVVISARLKLYVEYIETRDDVYVQEWDTVDFVIDGEAFDEIGDIWVNTFYSLTSSIYNSIELNNDAIAAIQSAYSGDAKIGFMLRTYDDFQNNPPSISEDNEIWFSDYTDTNQPILEIDFGNISTHNSSFFICIPSEHDSEFTIAHFDSVEYSSDFFVCIPSEHSSSFFICVPSEHSAAFNIYGELLSNHNSSFNVLSASHHHSEFDIYDESAHYSEFIIHAESSHYSEFEIHFGHNTTFHILGHADDTIQIENRTLFDRDMKNLFPKWIKPEPDTQLEKIQDSFIYEIYYSLQLMEYIKDYLNIDEVFLSSSSTNNIDQNIILDNLFTYIYNRQRHDNETDEDLRDRMINYFGNFVGGGNIEQWRNSLERMFDLPDDERIRGYEPCKAYYASDIFAGKTQVTTLEHPEAIGYSHNDSLRYIWDDEDDLTLGGLTSESWRFELADARKIASFHLELPSEYEAVIGGAGGGIEAFYGDKIDTPFASIIDYSDDSLKANTSNIVKEDLNIYYIDLEDHAYYSGLEPLYELPYSNLNASMDYDPATFIKFADYLKYHMSTYYTWGAQWDHYSSVFILAGSNNWTWFKVANFDSSINGSMYYNYDTYQDTGDYDGRAIINDSFGPIEDWDDCIDGITGAITTEFIIQSRYVSTGDGAWYCSRGFVSFTSSIIEVSDIILKATLKLKTVSVTNSPLIMIQKWTAADNNITVFDFDDCGTNLIDSPVHITAADTWYEFEFNQTGLDYIIDSYNTDGYVKFCVRESFYDIGRVSPDDNYKVEFRDCIGVLRPLLYLEYA